VIEGVTVGVGLGDQTLTVAVFVALRVPVVVREALRLPVPELDVEGVAGGVAVCVEDEVAVRLEVRLAEGDLEDVFVELTEGNIDTVAVPVRVWVTVLEGVFVGVIVVVRVGVSGFDPETDRVIDAEYVYVPVVVGVCVTVPDTV
jgi:hypothetical protein